VDLNEDQFLVADAVIAHTVKCNWCSSVCNRGEMKRSVREFAIPLPQLSPARFSRTVRPANRLAARAANPAERPPIYRREISFVEEDRELAARPISG
jgi:hypothetical protein